MRCTVCGCDILPNRDSCQNCGTRIIEMTGLNQTQPSYSNSYDNSYNNGFNGNVMTAKKDMSMGKKVLILLLALVLGVAVGFGYWYYHNVSTHTIREEGFTIELPRSLEKTNTTDYAALSETGSVQANGKYANMDTDFQYMILDYSSSLAGTSADAITEEFFVSFMKSSFKQQFEDSFKEVYSGGNKLKITYHSSSGEDVYNYTMCKKSGSKFYWFVFGCKADEKDFYDPKFEKWASTIHIN